MNYESVEGLSDEKLNEFYNEIVEYDSQVIADYSYYDLSCGCINYPNRNTSLRCVGASNVAAYIYVRNSGICVYTQGLNSLSSLSGYICGTWDCNTVCAAIGCYYITPGTNPGC